MSLRTNEASSYINNVQLLLLRRIDASLVNVKFTIRTRMYNMRTMVFYKNSCDQGSKS